MTKFRYNNQIWNLPDIPLYPMDCEHCVYGSTTPRNAALGIKCKKRVIRVLDMATEQCSEFQRKESKA